MGNLKRIWMVLFVVGIIPLYSASGQQMQKVKKVIVIDPGHGGIDSGAIGINELKEKDIVLEIAMEMLKWNKTVLNNRYDIYLTRYSDTLISLSHRAKLVNIVQPDLLISLHGNHSVNPKAKGIEVFVYNNIDTKSKNGRQSVKMANYIIKQLGEKLGYRTRGVKKENFQVLRETINTCPAVLIELGFLSNKDEVDYLKKEQNINVLALAILMSIKIK
ncbi:MAG: N-acetylmuramoyl-L-alanine amidase [Flavobacteriaceae bacterium]|nr:N-acetylmuramoyl-L-alanine amidase [Flavobacteriaceae bacterium]